MLSKRLLQFVIAVLLMPALSLAQNTTSSMSGTVKTTTGEELVGATVTATHEPTGTVYRVQSRTGGRFNINNMNPGGPYSVEVSFVNFANEKKTEIYLSLGESFKLDFAMANKAGNLGEVTVSASRRTTEASGKGGAETLIGRDKMANLPTVGRNIYDYLRAVPQAKLGASEGAVTIAGQNNRYNSFYVDGAVNNDVFGLSASGTNGGQAAIAPISIDAIDQFQVVISPFDASLGNFVGGGINAITRSGTNKTEGSVYYFLQNEKLAGKTPTGLKQNATRLGNFSKKTYGFRVGGAITKNKLFYFINVDLQRDVRPQPFDFSQYRGNSNLAAITGLANTLRTNYGYEAGGFLDNTEEVNADRITARIDWNISDRHKLSVSNRYTKGERLNTSTSSSTTINFYNNGFSFPTRTNSTSAELKSLVGKSSSNKLLITFTDVLDDRSPIGQNFPRVRINDGAGALVFGPDNSSTVNYLRQKNWSLYDEFKFTLGKHSMKVGVDYEYSDVVNAFIQNTFGNYTYSNLNDFLTNARPQAYTYGFSNIDAGKGDATKAAADFLIAKGSLFANDEIRASDNLSISLGVRADYYKILSKPWEDVYTNTVAIPKFSEYYNLQGARSGMTPKIPLALSPRVGFTYKIPEENLVVRGGMGLFTGRIPLVWPGAIFNNNGIFVGGYSANATQLNTIRFRPDPSNQWSPAEVGAGITKGPLNLTAAEFKVPKLFRTSIAFDKKFGDGWSGSLEAIYSKNLNEIYYTNINLLPPVGTSLGAGSRNVYPTTNNGRIPLNADGSNPYDNAILLSNNQGPTGYAYNFTASVSKRTRTGFAFDLSYTFGNSTTVNDGTSSVNLSQWRFMETVNGRNFITRSNSDFSAGHRIFAYLSKKFEYANKKLATTVTLVYTGQSGNPYSYVYGVGSMVRDDGTNGTNDLIYIPTSADLSSMIFLSNTVSGVTYTPDQQRAALESFIQSDNYLRQNRGKFAERNGSRLPFTNIIDLKIAQDFNIKVGNRRYQFQLTYDVFNFGNMLNRNWGRTYFLSNDNFQLIQFAGYVNAATNLTPQFRFNPTQVGRSPWNVSTTTNAAYAARWISQVGLRFNF
ncbi:carboxypeptidase regulatory-like domain-containing protein [Sediminibacterium sp. KACHI17]|uniref:Carboxypeptidase regulatory-like domain-containing protein n=1 Tax=Sediminibacterium sp. KACHI17 TaxID=1751071 RepID=A0AAT9GHQ9_9BACT